MIKLFPLILMCLSPYFSSKENKTEFLCRRVVDSETIATGVIHEFLFRSDSSIVYTVGGDRFIPEVKCWGFWYWNGDNVIITHAEKHTSYEIVSLSSLDFLVPIDFIKEMLDLSEMERILEDDWIRNSIKSRKEKNSNSQEPLSQIEFDLLREKLIGLPIFIQLSIPKTKTEQKQISKKRKFKGKC